MSGYAVQISTGRDRRFIVRGYRIVRFDSAETADEWIAAARARDVPGARVTLRDAVVVPFPPSGTAHLVAGERVTS